MTPFDDFIYLINHVLLGEEPTIEDFILLVGTLVAFIAFILWCCFPIQPKEPGMNRPFSCKIIPSHIKVFDPANRLEDNGTTTSTAAAEAAAAPTAAAAATTSTMAAGSSNGSHGNNGSNGTAGGIINGASANYNGGGSGSYSKNGTVGMHNYYVKNGHHCCT